jgi:hypothetical protein
MATDASVVDLAVLVGPETVPPLLADEEEDE